MRKDINEYYRALGINPGADPAQIRRAYRQLVQQWHPDLFKQGSPMQTTAEDITKEINEAYEQLYRKGLYKKFRAAAGAEPPVAPEESPADASQSPEGNANKTRPRAKANRRRERPAPAARAPEGPTGKKSWSFPGNRRILSRTFWTRAALAAALMVAALAAGTVVWTSLSEQAPRAALLQHTEPAAAAAAPSQAGARSEHPAAPSANAAVPAGLTPVPTEQIYASPVVASARGTQPDEFNLVGGPRTKAYATADAPTLFDRAEALLDVFEVGDTKARVRAIQGEPDDTAEHVFRYGSSLVYFREGRVWNWSDGQPHLRVRALPAFSGSLLDTFSMGSTRGDVVRAQGQPSAFTADGYSYGSSAVYFDNDRVRSWSEGDVALKKLDMPILPFFDLDSLTFR